MLRIHPENPKLFEFRGKPLVLLTATEHYGAVMNRPFRFGTYLAEAADKRMTLTRLFLLFRELQTPINPYSTCKPESPDYIAPYLRTGPGRAQDEEPKFDLDQANPEFYERLHRFVSLAADYGIVVEVVLLSQTYAPHIWALNPLNSKNNINGLEDIEWPDYLSQRHPKLFARQAAHVRRIVTELNRYDNVLYEICNEPSGDVPGEAGHPTSIEVNAWLRALIRVVRETEASLPNRHLIAGQEATSFGGSEMGTDRSFRDLDYDVVNIHALPNTTYQGKTYNLGPFMSKQLALRALRDLGLAAYGERQPLNQDEDNIASQYKDVEAWTIHRKRAWTALLTGGHYDVIDFSIINYCETGTPESRAHLRTWFRHLSEFIHSFDLARARPLPGLVSEQPAHTLEVAFGVAGEDLVVYLADEREAATARDLPDGDGLDRGAGQPIEGPLTLDLPAGKYTAAAFDPRTGEYSAPLEVERTATGLRVALPRFVHDVAVRVRRQAGQDGNDREARSRSQSTR
jgi:hypothetical protein